MARLKEELLERTEAISHRVCDVADSIEAMGKSRRIVDQLYWSGTSIGANAFETSEALSRPDFCRGIGVILKELAEIRFWLRFVRARGWVKADRLAALQQELTELRLVYGAILARSRRKPKSLQKL